MNPEGHALWPDGGKISTNREKGGILQVFKDKFPQDVVLKSRHIELASINSIEIRSEERPVSLSINEVYLLDFMFDEGKEKEAYLIP